MNFTEIALNVALIIIFLVWFWTERKTFHQIDQRIDELEEKQEQINKAVEAVKASAHVHPVTPTAKRSKAPKS